MQEFAFIFGGAFGFIAVVLGAFANHLLKKRWPKDLIDSFEIGVKYQMYHALYLVLLGQILPMDSTTAKLSVVFSIIGTLLFSGSIYGICMLKNQKKPIKLLGPITPLGGLCLLLSWLFFITTVLYSYEY